MYKDKREQKDEDIIAGRNPVAEALKSGRPIDSVMVSRESTGGSMAAILAICRKKGVVVKEVSPMKLDAVCAGLNHQGVAAVVGAKEYVGVADILKIADEKNEPPFIVVADEINDPHNLGAIIRSAEAAGVHGVIIPKRNSVGLTMAVEKASAGALEYMPVARVANLVAAVEELKSHNIWIYGADMAGKPVFETDFSGGTAVVIGSEGSGISRLLKEKCDFLVSLPMKGHISSLNASVACGVILYEALRTR